MAEQYDDIKKAQEELRRLNQEYQKLTGKKLFADLPNDLKVANTQIKVFESSIRSVNRQAAGLSDIFSDMREQLKANVGELDKASNSINTGKRAYRDLVKNVRELADEEAGIGRLSFANLKKVRQRADSSLLEIKLAAKRLMLEKGIRNEQSAGFKDLTENEQALVRARLAGFEAEKEAVKFTGYRLDLERKVLDSVKLTGGALNGIGNLASSLGLSGFAESLEEIKEGLDNDLRKKIREAAQDQYASKEGNKKYATSLKFIRQMNSKTEELTDSEVRRLKLAEKIVKDHESGVQALYSQVKAASGLTAKLKAVGKAASEFAKQLSDPLVIITSIVKGFMAIDAAATDFQRQTGQNAKALAGQNDELVSSLETLELMASFAKETNLNLNDLVSTEEVGRIRDLGDKLGLTVDESAKLALNTQLSGESVKDFGQAAFDAAKETAIAAGSGTNLGTALQEASKASGALALNLGNNPEELGRAAVQAQRLGLNLQQMEGIATGMLDFESSIQNELEAQLLTGKRINLAKAREFALRGQLGDLAEEIGKQEGVMEAFSSRNLIAQEAAAKAVGMTRNELAKTIALKAIEDGLGEKAAARMSDMNIDQVKQLDVQQKINKAMGKLQQAAAPLLDMLVPLLDVFTMMVRPLARIIADFSKFGSTVRAEMDGMTKKIEDSPFLSLLEAGGKTAITIGIASKSIQMLMSAIGMSKGTFFNPMYTVDATKGGLKTMFEKLVKFLPFGIGTALKGGLGTLSNGFRAVAQGAFRNGFKLIGRGVMNLGTKVLLPLTAIVQTIKGIGDFFFSSKLMETGAAGLVESLGGTGAKIIETVSFGLSKAGTNELGLTMKDFDTDDLAGARAIYRKNNPDAPTTIPNTTLLKDIKTNPQLYPEGFDDQAAAARKHIDADDFTIRTNPKDTLIMAGGTQFGEETNALLRQLIAEVSNIQGDVYIDGYKAGQSIFAASNNLPS